MHPTGYAAAWTRDDDLDTLNRRIHDGVPVDQLAGRARTYRSMMFETVFPAAAPGPGDRVLEFGSGVGWIMEAVLERFPAAEVVGLDISEPMVRRARERFSHPRARFVVYDGFTFPFPDNHFQVIYSCAAVQHIEKHVAFLLFREMRRVLAPGGHVVLHMMSVHHMPRSAMPYEMECWNHINNADAHWHHYYAFDELFVLLSELVGVDELDIRPYPDVDSFLVHFSKQTGRRFLRPELPMLTYPQRLGAPTAGGGRAAAPGVAPPGPRPAPGRLSYLDGLHHSVARAARPFRRLFRRLVGTLPRRAVSATGPKQHRLRFRRYFRGTGIEMGALHNPMPVDMRRATVRYVDRIPLDEQRRHYPELKDSPLMEPDLVAEADRLTPLADASQDFVIANHLLEHLPDPIGALKEWHRVLKPGSVLFLALPDKRLTFDRHRPRTTLAHLIADHRDGGAASRPHHYEEYTRLVDGLTGDDAVRHAERLMAMDYSIHLHVWIPEDIRELLAYLADTLGLGWQVVEQNESTGSDEFIYILRKPR